MKTYNLYIDRKYNVWERTHYTIEAESEGEAIKKCLNDEVDCNNSDMLYDTLDQLDPDDQPTIEVYDKDSKKIIYDNIKGIYDIRNI